MATSNWTKITMVINNGKYGHAESHFLAVSLSQQALLRRTVDKLVSYRAALLGNGQTVSTNYIKASDTPQVQYVRITDAETPRLGQVYDLSNVQNFGVPSSPAGSHSADFGATAMSVRLISGINANNIKNTTCQLVFNPDILYAKGAFQAGLTLSNGTTWMENLQTYIGFLLGAGGQQFGIYATNPAATVEQCTNVALVAGLWTFTFPGAGWVTGDRVRFTRFNPVFNGIWTVVSTTPNIYTLRNQPVSGHAVPPLGKGVIQQFSTGVNARVFQSYDSYQIVTANVPQVKPAKHNPGREWNNISFHHRVRRER
jgi:hypothetical protein